MNAVEVLKARKKHAYLVLESGAVVQLRKPEPRELREAGLAVLTGLSDAMEAESEAEDEAKIAAGRADAETLAKSRRTIAERRLARLNKALARNPALADQWAANAAAWVIAAVCGLGIAAEEVAPGLYLEAPATLPGQEIMPCTFSREAADGALDVRELTREERQTIAIVAQQFASAKEALRGLGREPRAPAGV